MAIVPSRRRDRGEIARFQNEMDNLFGRFFGDLDWPVFNQSRWPALTHNHWPALDVAENEHEYLVKAEVPGCKAEDIDISVHGNVLTISGEKKEEHEKKEKGYYHIERSYGSFQRNVDLMGDVDIEEIEAECKDGVLTITVPKSEKAKPVKVKVKEK